MDFFDQLDAIHPGHGPISDYHFNIGIGQNVESDFAASDAEDVKSREIESLNDGIPSVRIVVYDQHSTGSLACVRGHSPQKLQCEYNSPEMVAQSQSRGRFFLP